VQILWLWAWPQQQPGHRIKPRILACQGLFRPSGIAGNTPAGYNPLFAEEQSGRTFQPIFFARNETDQFLGGGPQAGRLPGMARQQQEPHWAR
jgi:hypothetical protein